MPVLGSSVVREATYDAGAERLEILFTSGERYAYDGVPADLYDGLIAAPSHGRYFTAHIRDRYPYRRLG